MPAFRWTTHSDLPLGRRRSAAWVAPLSAAAGALVCCGTALAQVVTPTTCSARTGTVATTVVELYTSEGCSSCPPADRWLSSLKADPARVALSFHVSYWDRLGWRDRFASAAYTQRQRDQQSVNGSRYSYTPQVVIQGRDRRDWPAIRWEDAAGSVARAPIDIALSGDGRQFTATVQTRPGAPSRLAAYWAVTENGHRSNVTAGENAGEKLSHDHVVRELQEVPVWTEATTTLQFNAAGVADPTHPRSINLVVVDAASERPVQAVKLGC